ncbi:MAG: phytanoyl-CoA dioxygenase family protein [Rhodoferax sp.]|nr:phytanoyl-CoA dioxygenase family protein [Burkholderiaceae bacterium]MBP9930655.1 phytanoyl-CoA dioxygenase family protein [Rhodoferax sp.]
MDQTPSVAPARAMSSAGSFVSKGVHIEPSLVGEYRDSSDLLAEPEQLRTRLAEDGYLLLRGVLDTATVSAARREIFTRLAEVGEVREPVEEGIVSGNSRRRELYPDTGVFWKSVCEGPRLRKVTHGEQLTTLQSMLFGEPAVGLDFIALRTAAPGRSTGLHFDGPYFTRYHERVHTSWIPLGDVPPMEGPLVVVEGSNRFEDLIAGTRGFDIALDPTRRADLEDDFGTLARARGTRILTTHFRPGDVLVFGMYTLHGALDNVSPIGRVRLSVDVRYQPTSAPRDARYFGPNPGGHTSQGYGALNGSRPLIEDWHQLTGESHANRKT